MKEIIPLVPPFEKGDGGRFIKIMREDLIWKILNPLLHYTIKRI
jgi:hypothetical protein